MYWVTTWSYLVDWSACCRIRESIMRASLSLFVFFSFPGFEVCHKSLPQGHGVSLVSRYQWPTPMSQRRWCRSLSQGNFIHVLLFLMLDPWTGGSDVGLLWEKLFYSYSPVCLVTHTKYEIWLYHGSAPSLLSCWGSFFMALVVADIFW